MTALQQFYLKLFLLMAIPFLLASMLVSLVLFGNTHIGFDLLEGLLFGGLMTMLFSYIQKSNLKQLGVSEWSQTHLKTHQGKVMESQLKFQDIVAQLKSQSWVKEIITSGEGKITMKTSPSSWSWGEIVELVWKDSSIQVTSRPRLSWAPFDGAKNLRNLIQIEELIAK